MEKPAVKQRKTTAGNPTERLKKYIASAGAGVAFLLLCAFSPGMQAEALTPPAQETKTVTVTEKIPFETTYIDLPNTYRGYTELVSEGVMGERQVEAQVIYEGDKMVRVVSIKTTETGQPVNQVIRRGTKLLRTQTVDGSVWKTSFANPLKTKGWLSADFYDYHAHNGIDLAAPYGTPVYAAAGGTVELSGWYGEYGRCVIIGHADGSKTLYGHNSKLNVSVGQTVKQGEKIAEVGSTGNSTGNHLHFEIRVGGTFLDPLVYMDK